MLGYAHLNSDGPVRIQNVVLATLVTSLLFVCNTTAQAASLKKITGIWAHSAADCKRDIAGSLKRGEIDRVTATSYEMVGICTNGLELLFQPHHCTASSIHKISGGLEFRGRCRVKDYQLTSRFNISVKSSRVISFNKKDFDKAYFWIEGSYVRCTRSYVCGQPLDP